MVAERRAYLGTSALAKWYLNEPGSKTFVSFLQCLDSAVISSLTVTEMLLFATFLEDIDRGWLQRYPFDDARFGEASNLIARYPEQPLHTLDALHLTLAAQMGLPMLATADTVMAEIANLMGFDVQFF